MAVTQDPPGTGKRYADLEENEPDLEARGAPTLDKCETLGTELRRRGLRITFQVCFSATGLCLHSQHGAVGSGTEPISRAGHAVLRTCWCGFSD